MINRAVLSSTSTEMEARCWRIPRYYRASPISGMFQETTRLDVIAYAAMILSIRELFHTRFLKNGNGSGFSDLNIACMLYVKRWDRDSIAIWLTESRHRSIKVWASDVMRNHLISQSVLCHHSYICHFFFPSEKFSGRVPWNSHSISLLNYINLVIHFNNKSKY